MSTMLSTAHALNGRNSESKSEVGPKKKLARAGGVWGRDYTHAIGGLPVASSSAVYEALQFRYHVRRTIY